MNTLLFHFDESIFKNFNEKYWNPRVSDRNKYKQGTNEPKFWGSTTIFAWTSDWFHKFQLVFLNSLSLSFALLISKYPLWISFLVARGIIAVIWKLTFEGFFIRKKK